jgi:WD40 repeat protein/energy-coupling factor transporter ATP-binding protein EcfA2
MSRNCRSIKVSSELQQKLLAAFNSSYRTPGRKRARPGELLVHWEIRLGTTPPSDQAVSNLLTGKQSSCEYWLVDGLCQLLLGSAFATLDKQDWDAQAISPKLSVDSETEAERIPIPPCPYRGLYAFQEDDADYFFGRESFVEQLVATVHKNTFIPVIGRSGSGKSSVIFAGLFPRLRQLNVWHIIDCRPGRRPFYSLAKALLPLLEPQWQTISMNERRSEAQKLACALSEEKEGLKDLIEDILSNFNYRFLIFIDQFEEIFTLCTSEERENFLTQLLLVSRDFSENLTRNFSLVFTLRDDFLGEAIDSPIGVELQRFKPEILCPMTRQELRDAIEKPAEKMSVNIEECLTERILDAVCGEPGLLPCLEFSLTQLWEKQHKKQLNHSAYQQIGGVEKALANHAEEIFDGLDAQEQQQVQRIFIQLVNFDTCAQDTRRLATRSQVGSENWRLVTKLATTRLVVTGRDELTKEETVEIVHEALIRGWERLRKWIEENHQFRLWQERLRTAIERWKAIEYDEGGLLQKALLTEAEKWSESRSTEITFEEFEFIRASREYENRGRKLQSELRRKAELSEIDALISLAQARLLLQDQIGALVTSIRAGRKVRKAESPPEGTKQQVTEVLRQALSKAQEFNRFQVDNVVNEVCISADGKMIAAAVSDRTVRIWQPDGILYRTLEHEHPVYGIAFSPDGSMIASGCTDPNLRIWSVHTGELLEVFGGHTKMINKVSWSTDGLWIASASDDATVILRRINGEIVHTLQHDDMAYGAVFSPNNQLLASASLDKTVRIWNITDGKLLHEMTGHAESVNRISFSSDGCLIASASDDKTVKLWQVENGSLLDTFAAGDQNINTVSFSSDGQTIASGSTDGNIRLWRIDGTPLHTFQGHTDRVFGLAFSPDGNTLVSGAFDKTVRLWKIDRTIFYGHGDQVFSVDFSPVSQLIASGGWDKTVRLWRTDGTPVGVLQDHSDRVFNVCFSPDGSLLASASDDTTVKFWDVANGVEVLSLQGHTNRVYGVSFSPDGRLIATSSHDKTVRLWRVSDGKLLKTFEGHTDWVYGVSFSPTGKFIVSGSHDSTIRLWRLDGSAPEIIGSHDDRIWSVSVSPNGQLIASASFDRTVRIWTLDGILHHTFEGHSDVVNRVAWSQDGQVIASTSNDRSIRLWHINGALVDILEGHLDKTLGVAFSSNGQLLASTSYDKTVRLWKLEPFSTSGNQDFQLDRMLTRSCAWLEDYLRNNSDITEVDRNLCFGIDDA